MFFVSFLHHICSFTLFSLVQRPLNMTGKLSRVLLNASWFFVEAVHVHM